MIDDKGMALITQAIKSEMQVLHKIMDVQAQLLGITIGLVVDKDLISRADLISRIETVSRDRPEYQQHLLAIVQQPLSAQH